MSASLSGVPIKLFHSRREDRYRYSVSRGSPSYSRWPCKQPCCGDCSAKWRRLADRRSSAHRLWLVESVLGGRAIVVVEFFGLQRRRVLYEVDEVECTGAGRSVTIILDVSQQRCPGNISNCTDAVRDVLLTFAYLDLQFVLQRLNLQMSRIIATRSPYWITRNVSSISQNTIDCTACCANCPVNRVQGSHLANRLRSKPFDSDLAQVRTSQMKKKLKFSPDAIKWTIDMTRLSQGLNNVNCELTRIKFLCFQLLNLLSRKRTAYGQSLSRV